MATQATIPNLIDAWSDTGLDPAPLREAVEPAQERLAAALAEHSALEETRARDLADRVIAGEIGFGEALEATHRAGIGEHAVSEKFRRTMGAVLREAVVAAADRAQWAALNALGLGEQLAAHRKELEAERNGLAHALGGMSARDAVKAGPKAAKQWAPAEEVGAQLAACRTAHGVLARMKLVAAAPVDEDRPPAVKRRASEPFQEQPGLTNAPAPLAVEPSSGTEHQLAKAERR